MKELVTQILNGREKIEDVYFVACGGSLVDLYPGYYFVRTESKTMHADWITSKEFVVTPPTPWKNKSCIYLLSWWKYKRDCRSSTFSKRSWRSSCSNDTYTWISL